MAQMFFKIGVVKNFTTFTRKHETQHRCFPVNVAKFLRLTFFTEHLWWLLLFLLNALPYPINAFPKISTKKKNNRCSGRLLKKIRYAT